MSVSVNNRSAVANGTRHFPARRHGGPDLRLRWGRRWRDVMLDFAGQLGHEPSPAEQALLRSAADIQIASERLSGEFAAGHLAGADDLDRLHRLNGSLRHTLRQLGLGVGATEDRGLTDLLGGSRR
jgi:hypothetical protein